MGCDGNCSCSKEKERVVAVACLYQRDTGDKIINNVLSFCDDYDPEKDQYDYKAAAERFFEKEGVVPENANLVAWHVSHWETE